MPLARPRPPLVLGLSLLVAIVLTVYSMIVYYLAWRAKPEVPV